MTMSKDVSRLFQKEQKFEYPLTEKVVISSAIVLILLSGTLFFTNASFRYYFFKTGEDELFSVPLGKVMKINGGVSRERAGVGEFRRLATGDLLYPMDSVMTGSGGQAVLELDNGEKIEMQPNSLVRLSFSFDFSFRDLVPKRFILPAAPKVQVIAGEAKAFKKAEPLPVFVPPEPKAPPPLVITLLSPQMDKEFTLSPEELIAGQKNISLEFSTNRLPDPLSLGVKRVSDGREVLTNPLEINKKEFSIPVALKNPGEYSWFIKDEKAKILAQSRFRVNPTIQNMIKVQPVSGVSNKLKGLSTTKDFDGFTLAWETSYPADGLSRPYRVTVYEEPKRRIVNQKSLKGKTLTFSKKQVTSKTYSYVVEQVLASGFILLSNEEKFGLNFLPPELVTPVNKVVVSLATLTGQVKRVYFTWSKTNFTSTYDLEISRSADFMNTQVKTQRKDNFYLWAEPKPGSYYWRVKSNHAENQSSGFTEPFVVNIVN